MKKLVEFIKQGTAFAVISHTSPDGDTMGSAAALIYALRTLGKQAKWFCDGEVPHDFMNLEQIASLIEKNDLKKYDSIICVDAADIERLGKNKQMVQNFPRVAQIDHHVSNTNYADINVVRDRNACAFAILELIDALEVELTTDIARALYVGICTDTGRLSYSTTVAQDVLDTARLYNYDLRPDLIVATLFRTKTLAATKLSGKAIEHLQVAFDGKVVYTYLDSEDFLCCNATNADSEGIIETCRNVEGALLAFFIRETFDGYKVSMRGTPGYNVLEICQKFGGGGHVLAAGCTINAKRDEVLARVLEEIEKVI